MSAKTNSLNMLINVKLVRFVKKSERHVCLHFKLEDWVTLVLHILDAQYLKNSKPDTCTQLLM